MKPLDKYLQILENIGEFFFLALLLAISVTFVVESWRRNFGYPVAAVIFGTIFGYGVMTHEPWSSFAVLATIVGTVTGPATIAAMQKKTVVDVAKDLKEVAEAVTSRRNRPDYTPRRRRDSDPRGIPPLEDYDEEHY